MMRLDEWLKSGNADVRNLRPINLIGYTPIVNISTESTRDAICDQLHIYLSDLVNWFKVSAKITVQELAQLVDMIVEKYNDFSVPDFFLFCRYAKTGSITVAGEVIKFELPYNRLDGAVICNWLDIYRMAKIEALETVKMREKIPANTAWKWTPEQSAAFDEYMKQLRVDRLAPKPQPDIESQERERSARREQMIAIAMNDLHGATIEELQGLIQHVAGDLILTEAVNRMIAAREGAGE